MKLDLVSFSFLFCFLALTHQHIWGWQCHMPTQMDFMGVPRGNHGGDTSVHLQL